MKMLCVMQQRRLTKTSKLILPLLLLLSWLSAGAAPFPSQLEPRLIDSIEGRLLGGTAELSHFGERVTGLGDVNGDGFDDYAMECQ